MQNLYEQILTSIILKASELLYQYRQSNGKFQSNVTIFNGWPIFCFLSFHICAYILFFVRTCEISNVWCFPIILIPLSGFDQVKHSLTIFILCALMLNLLQNKQKLLYKVVHTVITIQHILILTEINKSYTCSCFHFINPNYNARLQLKEYNKIAQTFRTPLHATFTICIIFCLFHVHIYYYHLYDSQLHQRMYSLN